MKGTENFKNVIQNHLNVIASKDALFAKNLAKENKNINDCITYIFNQVKQSGCTGFADDEIFNMAIHYYDEENIKVGKPISGQVVVNHTDNNTKTPVQEKPSDKRAKVVKMDPVNQISIFDIPGV
ncbi:PcfK-like family protein [Empedobacter falsenii]|uniref:PcfK-like family protein n=1 Tax=Empedobacter falsenii TaxID=343874 RepID=UPI002574F877|nr:PcfK-like family protein [Empedobacter falsenii]MDM1548604.1 PcfK-like family protein [Empedobacter falsenii]